MIERIDHIWYELATVENFDEARRIWMATGCPVTWDGPFEGPDGHELLFGVSIGPVNLEIVSKAPPHWPRTVGVASVAFDPGDIQTTVREFQHDGFTPEDPGEWQMGHHFVAGVPAEAHWWMAGLHDVLPGVQSFLCQYLTPQPHFGRIAPDSPIRFIELQVALPDPHSAVTSYERVLHVQAGVDKDGYTLPLADTPIRLVRGHGLYLVLEPLSLKLPLQALSAAIPGIRWRA